MRQERAVTQHEYCLKDTETIVSKTDLQGNITYVNQDFIRISGYSADELMGAPQNIVRHPDMPKEAFYDLWHTLRSGKAWTGLVKNRCKNGDHYWVEAHAAPITENGEVTGYTSIRVKPSREQVRQAEAAYRDVREGSRRITVREGAVIKRPRFARHPQHPPAELSLKSRLVLWTGCMIALFLLNAFIIWQLNLSSGSNTSGSVLPILAELTLLGGAVLAAFGGVAIYKRLISPLAQAQRDIDRMAAGDLSGRIDANGDNEIAHLMQSLRKLQINIKLLVGQIKESTDQVNQQATTLARDNGELAKRTESQAGNVEETSSAVTEITSIVQQHAENSEAANQLVASTAQAATRGAEAAEQVTRTMAEIQDSAKKIVDIIGVINSIAFQTNILALNAAVEAARAGEQGRGFAVVAAEVRNLALRSADAAKDIKSLIQDSANRVNAGSEQVEQTAQIMQDILGSARHATQIMGEIAIAGKEQSLGIEHINQAVGEIEAITQDNAVAVSTTARTAESLQEQAETLSQLINAFKLINTSSPAHQSAHPVQAAASRATEAVSQPTPPPMLAARPLLGLFKRRTPIARLKMG